jgi:hypothetical protein
MYQNIHLNKQKQTKTMKHIQDFEDFLNESRN